MKTKMKLMAISMVALMMLSGFVILADSEDSDAVGETYQVTLQTDPTMGDIEIPKNVVKVIPGDSTYMLTSDGELYGCGDNRYGQMGNGTTDTVLTPIQIGENLGKITDAYSSSNFILFLTEDGDLFGSGRNRYGTLGTGTTDNVLTPVQIGANLGAIKKVFWSEALFFQTADDKTYFSGDNSFGQLGTGNTNNVLTPTEFVFSAGTISNIISNGVTVIQTTDGKLYGMGRNSSDVLGTGNTDNVLTPTEINTSFGAVSSFISTNYNIYATTSDGKLYGCGDNYWGQLGQGNTTSSNTFVQIGSQSDTIVDFKIPSRGILYFKTSDGKLYGCGNNQYGQMGNGTTDNVLTPYWINESINSVKKAILLSDCVFILDSNDALFGAGNSNYHFSPGSESHITTLTRVGSDLGSISDFAVSDGLFIKNADNNWFVSGRNHYGQLGIGNNNVVSIPTYNKAVPRDAEVFVNASNNNYIITSEGKVYVAGSNRYGQLGQGNYDAITTFTRESPMPLSASLTITVAEGSQITTDGNTLTVDDITYSATPKPSHQFVRWNDVPQTVTEDVTITAEMLAITHNVTFKVDSSRGYFISPVDSKPTSSLTVPVLEGSVVETNFDILRIEGSPYIAHNKSGYIFKEWVNVPMSITKDVTITATMDRNTYYGVEINIDPKSGNLEIPSSISIIRCGYTTLFITEDGKLYGMGANNHGQLGNGTTDDVLTPIQIGSELGKIVFVSPNDANTTFFITEDGKLYGMGANSFGQIGIGTTDDVLTPVQVGSDLGVVTQVAGSDSTTFFITEDGKLYGMGKNDKGQIGNGTTANASVPVQIGSALGKISDFKYGEESLLFRTSDGKLYGCGKNTAGQLGNGTTSNLNTPTEIGSGLGAVTDYFIDDTTTFFKTSDGKLYACGSNYDGNTGNGTTDDVLTPIQVLADIGNIKKIVSPANNTYCLTEDGKLYGWGENWAGQVGNNEFSDSTAVLTPYYINKDLGKVADVIYDYSTAYFLTEDGKVYGIGYNGCGELGQGHSINIPYPVQIAPTKGKIVSFSASEENLLMLTSDGRLYGCGNNGSGQLGMETAEIDEPNVVRMATTVTKEVTKAKITTPYGTPITSDGNVLNIGDEPIKAVINEDSEDALYTFNGWSKDSGTITANTTIKANISALKYYDVTVSVDADKGYIVESNDLSIVKIAPNGNTTFFLTSDGKLYGMGWNNNGQQGDGTTTNVLTPTQIGADLGTITDVACSSNTTFFLTSDGKLYGMGGNSYGQQGNGTTTNVLTPTQIGADLGTITDVACPERTTFFITSDGKLYGMGRNNNGQQGNGTTADVLTPTQIGADLGTITDVACSNNTTFFLTSDGKLYGMGWNNYGQQGNGTTADVLTPTQIGADLGTITDVACSPSTTFFLTSDGKLYGMGWNNTRQQGDGTKTNVLTPTQIGADLGTITDVACFTNTTFFITSDGKLYGTGWNENGQQGNGTTADVLTPTQIGADLGTITDVACSNNTTFFITSDGKLYGTGWNNYGQQGNGTTADVLTPTQIGADLGTITDVACSNNTTFFLTSDGKLYGTGWNNYGQQGDGTTTNVLTPTQIIVNIESIAQSVTYRVLQGTSITYDGSTITIGDNTVTVTVLPSTEQYEYTFKNWSSSSKTVSNNMTIKANISKDVRSYTITWVIDDKQVTTEVKYGAKPYYASPYKANYTFNGWEPAIASVTGDATYTASFTPIEYTVKWDANGGSVDTASSKGSAEVSITAPTPTRDDYNFVGWYTAKVGGTKLDPTTFNPTANKTYFARWAPIEYTVTLTTDPAGGVIDGETAITANNTDGIKLPSVTLEGKYFAGWYNGATAVGVVGSNFYPTQDVTLTAKFSDTPVYLRTVDFNTEGGNGNVQSVVVEASSEDAPATVTIPSTTPSKNGMTFEGWATSPNGKAKYQPGDTIEVKNDQQVKLYAVWDNPNDADVSEISYAIPVFVVIGLLAGIGTAIFHFGRNSMSMKELIMLMVGASVAVIVIATLLVPIVYSL